LKRYARSMEQSGWQFVHLLSFVFWLGTLKPF
jgi:hypothetical protein